MLKRGTWRVWDCVCADSAVRIGVAKRKGRKLERLHPNARQGFDPILATSLSPSDRGSFSVADQKSWITNETVKFRSEAAEYDVGSDRL